MISIRNSTKNNDIKNYAYRQSYKKARKDIKKYYNILEGFVSRLLINIMNILVVI